MQWLVLCGIPYRGSDCAANAASTDPTNQLPTSLVGQATRPPGTPLLICNFLRVAQATSRCNSRSDRVFRAESRLVENINHAVSVQASGAVETTHILWETPAQDREIRPKSVSPFTKNCIASATSSKPMMRTRIRMPVSPITLRTRPAPARIQ